MPNVIGGVSVLEFAYLSQDVYRNDGGKKLNFIAPLWKAADEDFLGHYQPHWAQAFFARLYFRYPRIPRGLSSNPNAPVLAYRGTMPKHLDNDTDDADIALGKMPHSELMANYIYSNTFRECLKQHNLQVKLTGHSLGGALAQITAINQKTIHPNTIVFNSPGVGDLPIKKEDYDFIYNFNASDGVINEVGKTLGHVTQLNIKKGEATSTLASQTLHNPSMYLPGASASALGSVAQELAPSIAKQHIIADVIAALKNNPAIAKETF